MKATTYSSWTVKLNPREKIFELLKFKNDPVMNAEVFKQIDEIVEGHNDRYCHIRPVWLWIIIMIAGLAFGVLFALTMTTVTSLSDEQFERAYDYSSMTESLQRCNERNKLLRY